MSMRDSARIACGWGAAHHGENSPGQWDHLARWAGFESWADLEANAPRELTGRARAAVVQRRSWDEHGRAHGRHGSLPWNDRWE